MLPFCFLAISVSSDCPASLSYIYDHHIFGTYLLNMDIFSSNCVAIGGEVVCYHHAFLTHLNY